MKFAEHLGTHLTPEWRSQYVQYDEMKKFIYEASEAAEPDLSEVDLFNHFKKYEEGFFTFCDKELAKVNTFFAEKMAESVRKLSAIQQQMAAAGFERMKEIVYSVPMPRKNEIQNGGFQNGGFQNGGSHVNGNEASDGTLNKKYVDHGVSKKKLKEIKFVVGEYYLSLVLIQNFQQLNFTAFRKILKKHDKIFKTTSGAEYRKKVVEVSSFYTNEQINTLILETETIAIDDLEGGDRSKAMNRLRVPPLNEKQNTTVSYFGGLFTGLFVVLVIVVGISAQYKGAALDWQPAVRMYRGLLVIYLMFGLLGLNVYGWGRAGVNHVLIFELDPRDHLTFAEYLMLSFVFGVLWCLSCLAFLFSKDFEQPMFAHPLALGVFSLLYLINPTKTFQYRSRRWLLKVLFRIAVAPFKPVRFADFWLADQLNSLVVPLLDIEYLICYYSYEWYRPEHKGTCHTTTNGIRPIIALLPAWFRFAQCLRRYKDTRKAFPHLVNAGKYSTSMFVTIFSTVTAVKQEASTGSRSALFYIWIVSLIVSTFYTLFWDLKMDWGLFAKNAGQNKLLREQIVYDHKVFYYLAMLGDVIFRFLWTLTVSVGLSGFFHHEFFTLFLAVCEVIRRFVWNFFRLENEHLNNVGEFRAVRDINIKPMRKDESSKSTMTLEEVMDGDDGPPSNKTFQYTDTVESQPHFNLQQI